MITETFRSVKSAVQFQLSLKLVSLGLAVLLWFVVLGSKTIEVTKEIPIEVVLGDDLILTEPIPERVTVRIAGPKAFLRSIANRIEDPIKINLENKRPGVFTQRLYSDLVKLPVGVKVLSMTPGQINIKLEELRHKMVPLQLEMSGDLPVGLKLIRAEANPAVIRIRGPRQRLALIQQITALPIDLSSLHESSVIPLGIDLDSLGVELEGVTPEAWIEIEGRGFNYRIRNIPIQLKSTRNAELYDQNVSIILRTDIPMHIDVDKIKAEIDVRDLPAGDYYKWVRMTLPDGMHLVRMIPGLVRVSVGK